MSKNHLKKKQESWLFCENLPLLAPKSGKQTPLEEGIRERAEEHLNSSAPCAMVRKEVIIETMLTSVTLIQEDFLEFPSQWGNISNKLNLFGIQSYLCMLEMIHIEENSKYKKRYYDGYTNSKL